MSLPKLPPQYARTFVSVNAFLKKVEVETVWTLPPKTARLLASQLEEIASQLKHCAESAEQPRKSRKNRKASTS